MYKVCGNGTVPEDMHQTVLSHKGLRSAEQHVLQAEGLNGSGTQCHYVFTTRLQHGCTAMHRCTVPLQIPVPSLAQHWGTPPPPRSSDCTS